MHTLFVDFVSKMFYNSRPITRSDKNLQKILYRAFFVAVEHLPVYFTNL